MTTCALYVPGSRPDRFDKAAASGADTVILDLEDSVAATDKPAARSAVAQWLASRSEPQPSVQVRTGAPGSADLAADLGVLPPDVALRVPKVSSPGDLDGLEGREVHVILETALGIEHAYAIASHLCVASLALGEADLSAELGWSGEDAFAWVRARVVVAARAAGLPAPMMSAYPDLRDLEGLAASCRAGRARGFHGRTALHPSQVPVIRAAFAPTEDEVRWAEEVLGALSSEGGTGVARLADGSMVDAAMARRARTVLSRREV